MTSASPRCDGQEEEEEDEEEEKEASSNSLNLANFQFPDDFDEFLARADSGGSTYGLLKRHAFAHSSLRERPTTAELQRPAQRQRSKSLIPPAEANDLTDEKTLIKALCEHTAAANADRDSLRPLQVVDHRRRSTSAALALAATATTAAAASASAGHDPKKRVSYALTSPEFPGGAGSRGPPPPQVLVEPATDATGWATAVPFCRRRSFSVTPRGGLVNEGDEVIAVFPAEMMAALVESGIQMTGTTAAAAATDSRRSSNNSCEGGGGGGGGLGQLSDGSSGDSPVHKVLMLGGPGVGKTAITQQFLTSEFMAAQNTSFDDGREITVPVLLDGEESIMEFIDLPYSGDLDVWRDYDVDGYIIVYSITDRRSYQKASDAMGSIRDCAANDRRPVILVANKSDLERSRMIGKEEGKCLAQNNDCKYIEVSAILNHKIDDLLVGTLKQIRLRASSSQHSSSRGHRRRSTITTADPNNPTADVDAVSIGSTLDGDDRGRGSEDGGRSLGCLLAKSCRNGMFAKFFKGSKKMSSKSCENLLTS